MSHPASIPYSRILEALKSAWQICRTSKLSPNRFVLLFNPVDRNARASGEDSFIDEITRDIIYIQNKQLPKDAVSKIQVEIRTENKLKPGRMRIECFRDKRLLYRFEQEKDVEYSVDSSGDEGEWTAVDILPQEDKVGKCILIVDDEPVLCAVLQRMLTRLDYHVVSAHDGLEALKILSNMSIDLVITDLRMPKMDGWALMQFVKKNVPHVPVILITGYHSIHTQNKASESSADGYISKPFSMAQIKAILDSVLAEREDVNTSITYLSN
jgi:CheY-like chemotaxis protein